MESPATAGPFAGSFQRLNRRNHRRLVCRRKHQLVPHPQPSGLDPAGNDPPSIEIDKHPERRSAAEDRHRSLAFPGHRAPRERLAAQYHFIFILARATFSPCFAAAGITARASSARSTRNFRYSLSISRNRFSEKSTRSILFTTTIICLMPSRAEQISVSPALLAHPFAGGDHTRTAASGSRCAGDHVLQELFVARRVDDRRVCGAGVETGSPSVSIVTFCFCSSSSASSKRQIQIPFPQPRTCSSSPSQIFPSGRESVSCRIRPISVDLPWST